MGTGGLSPARPDVGDPEAGGGLDPAGAPLFDRTLLVGPVERAARSLLGALLVCRPADPAEQTVAIRLTEVEAYAGQDDPASHAARGRTARTVVMFGPPGRAYVYFSYGVHWCLNVVCERDGRAAAVLVRAGEVVAGHATARARRPAVRRDDHLARGPGVLTLAAGIGGDLTGTDLCDPASRVTLRSGTEPPEVFVGPRVGVSRAAEVRWRFWVAGHPTVSAYRRSPGAPRPT